MNFQRPCIMSVKVTIFTFLSFVSLLYTIFTGFELCLFLSSNRNGLLLASQESANTSIDGLCKNMGFVFAFVILHSLLASKSVKLLFEIFKLSPLHRSCYNVISCWMLKLLMTKWIVVNFDHFAFIWDCSDNKGLVLLFQILHIFGWFSIFSTIYILDFFEFVGLKQVQYFAYNLGCPMSLKSAEAQNFFSNLRHPVATGFLIVFWFVPCMTIDRFLLATVFSLYLFQGSKIDKANYNYLYQMYIRKNNTLKLN